ncbi:MAG: hypothetical protein ACKO48_08420 [Actinomycetota bacterium]
MLAIPRARDVLSQIKHFRNSTYGPLIHYPTRGSSVSDLFIGREGVFRTRFHGENTLALVVGQRIPVEHIIVQISADGNVINESRHMSDDFRLSIDLPVVGHEMYSFIHLTNYDKPTLTNITRDDRFVARNHRGYTGYLMRDSEMESVVHGNFGLTYLGGNGRLRSLARQKAVHRYTAQEVFGEAFRYELCFPNPTARRLRMDVDVMDSTGVVTETMSRTIPRFGTWMLGLDGDQVRGGRYLSWCSRLPVGRCVVFEVDDRNSTCNVFHS